MICNLCMLWGHLSHQIEEFSIHIQVHFLACHKYMYICFLYKLLVYRGFNVIVAHTCHLGFQWRAHPLSYSVIFSCSLAAIGYIYIAWHQQMHDEPSTRLVLKLDLPWFNFDIKSTCLQDEGVDYSSGCMRAFVWGFEGSQSSQWSYPKGKR